MEINESYFPEYDNATILLLLSSYKFDSTNVFKVFPIEIICIILDYLYIPYIEFEYSQYTTNKKYNKGRKYPYSIETFYLHGGWGRSCRIRNYCGYLTLALDQQSYGFWAALGIKAEVKNYWEGFYHGLEEIDYISNEDCLFLYRMDTGIINSLKPGDLQTLLDATNKNNVRKDNFSEKWSTCYFPEIDYDDSDRMRETIITFYFSPGQMSIVRCNRYELTKEQKEMVFEISKEFYLFVDINYADTTAALYCNDGKDLYKNYYELKKSENYHYAILLDSLRIKQERDLWSEEKRGTFTN